MSSIESNICQAVDIIVKKALSQAEYDRTILAQVISCIDATIGKYKVKYQDSVFYAYSNNVDTTYSKGTDVYILVPGGDLNQEKTILGTTKKLGINYINVIEGDDAYEYLGTNCINDSTGFELCSYKPETKIIYHSDSQTNLINLNIDNINEYIKGSSTLICGAYFKTNLDNEQRYQGNYGIIFELIFKDNSTGQEDSKYYVIDVNQMIGNPYKFAKETRQYGIFNIDGDNFVQVKSISLFVDNFPKKDNTKANDIFINNLELYAAQRIADADLNSLNLSLITLQGTYFPADAAEDMELSLEAQIKVKGKILNNNSQNVEYYWFVEHSGVNSKSADYNKHGGLGWKCLNAFTATDEDENGIVTKKEWVPGSHQFFVKKKDLLAKEVKYKCVAIYNNTAIQRTIILKNPGSNYNISIESDNGTKFYYDVGNPTLTCIVTKNTLHDEDYKYIWSKVDNTGHYEEMPESLGSGEYENPKYNQIVSERDALVAEIEQTGVTTAEQANDLARYDDYLTKSKNYCRIELNKIHYLQVRNITEFCTYNCSVYAKSKDSDDDYQYVGTSSITITNSMVTEGIYSVVINDGVQVFKYDADGQSPTSSLIDRPRTIKALTFTIYDNTGKAIDEAVAAQCEVQWRVPIDNTMLKIPTSTGLEISEIDEQGGYNIYKGIGLTSFVYDIRGSYSISKTRNNIQLVVKYQDMTLSASTNFTFTKDGEPGTNGSDYICKIIPNFKNPEDRFKIVPAIIRYKDGDTVKTKLNYETNGESWFIAQLWENDGEQAIFSGVDDNVIDNEAGISKVSWTVLKNTYSGDIKDTTHIIVTKTDGNPTKFSAETNYELHEYAQPADIIRVEIIYNDKTYFATYPIVYIDQVDTDKSFEVEINSGFNYVVFSSDGQHPQYDKTNPFKIIIRDNNSTDVSLQKEDGKSIYTYEYKILGNIYNTHTTQWVQQKNLKYLSDENYDGEKTISNQATLQAKAPYDGFCVNNALECIIRQQDKVIGKIHIPIHLTLNRYGLSALNQWDGNSIEINKDHGYILSPQIGAGVKHDTNGFTGVLMGKVEEGSDSKIGLLGYSQGQQSIFLDAATGKAEFGTVNKIIIDPNENVAVIKSNNYETIGDNKGGMQIDFATPEINFGTGNFNVNADGHITAKGGGSIAGWNIDNYRIYKDKTGLCSVSDAEDENGQIIKVTIPTSIEIKEKTNEDGTKEKYEEITPVDKALAFWAGSDTNPNFLVSHDGYLRAKEASIGGASSPIFIGRAIKIDAQGNISNTGPSAIFSGKKNYLDADATGFYLGTDGISIGGKNSDGNAKFKVTNQGYLTARDGKIGGWTINNSSLTANNITISSSGSIKHQNGNESKWGISSSGSAYFNSVIVNTTDGSTFNSTAVNPFQGTCITHINDLIVGTVTADYVSAKAIDAGFIKADTIAANYATITSLNAVEAKIKKIEADYITASELDNFFAKIDIAGIDALSVKNTFQFQGKRVYRGTDGIMRWEDNI